jgi:hypothetical protein
LSSLHFLALGFFVKLAKDCASISEVLENPVEYLRAVDIEAFRNLVDPKKEKVLRTNLSPAKFPKIQRQRLRAVEYVSCVAQNAAILLPLADAGRRSPDPATAEAAKKLVDSAVRLRLYAIQAIPRLYLRMIFPGARVNVVAP